MFSDLTVAIHSSSRAGDPSAQDRLLELLLLNGATVESLNSSRLDIVLIDIGRPINLRLPEHVFVLDYVWAELSARSHKIIPPHAFRPIFWGGSRNFFSQDEFLCIMPSVPGYSNLLKMLKCAGARICFDALEADVVLVDIGIELTSRSRISRKPSAHVVDYTWAELSLRCRCYFSVTPFLVNWEEPSPRPRIAGVHRLALPNAAYDDDEDFDSDTLSREGSQLGSPCPSNKYMRSSSSDVSSRHTSQTPEVKLEQDVPQNDPSSDRDLYPPPIPSKSICRNRKRDNEAVNQFMERLLIWELVRRPSTGVSAISAKVDNMKIFSPRRRVVETYWRWRRTLLGQVKRKAAEMRNNGFKAKGKFGEDIEDGRSAMKRRRSNMQRRK